MAAATKEAPAKNGNASQERPASNLPAIAAERLPYHPAIQERFGIDRSQWRALVEAVFPLAQTIDSIILALSYCRARKLDPFKKNVHIVPIWSSTERKMVDTIWPGIGELRTTAFRTNSYAGRDATVFGPDITRKVGSLEITFPEWAQVTVYRTCNGQRVPFAGPRVYWLETYSQAKRDDATPNSMWAKRTRGQIDKCAEAAALRAAFPEEIGSETIDDETGVIERANAPLSINATSTPVSRTEQLGQMLSGPAKTEEVQDAEVEPAAPEDLISTLKRQVFEAKTTEELETIVAAANTAKDAGEITEEQRAVVDRQASRKAQELLAEDEK